MASSAESNKLVLKAKGLYTSQNPNSAVPDGALLIAENIVIDKDDIAEIRRGFKVYGDAMSTNTDVVANQLTQYEERIYRHFLESSTEGYLDYQTTPGSTGFTRTLKARLLEIDTITRVSSTATVTTSVDHQILIGDTVEIDGATEPEYNGSFTVTLVSTSTTFEYTVTGAPATPATGFPFIVNSTYNNLLEIDPGLKVKSKEANQNLYLTTSEGVKKQSGFGNPITNSGIPTGLDTTLELYDSPGFFSQESQVGYRIVWGIKDVNDNLILGGASARSFIANSGLALLISDYNDTATKLNSEANLSDTYNTVASNVTLADLVTEMNSTVTKLNGEANLVGVYVAITAVTLEDVQVEYTTNIIDILNTTDHTPTNPVGVSDTYNEARTSQQVELNFSVPKDISVNHFYQIYRTSQSVALDVTPNEDYQLVYEGNPTFEQLALSEVDLVDITPDAFRGAALYQNSNQEGDAQANQEPPLAKDIALYNGMLFYGNTKTNQFLNLSLIGIDALSNLTTLSLDNGTNNFTLTFDTAAEDPANGQVLISSSISVATAIDETARSIVKCINRNDSNSFLYAYYVSNPDEPPGSIVIKSRSPSDPEFTAIATDQTQIISGNTYSSFSPSLVDFSYSENEEKPNRVYYSKVQEPEAVPSLNFVSVGAGNNIIYRLASLRDGLFIFSSDGIYKIVGDTPSGLSLAAFDNTTIIRAPESIAIGNNQIFLFTDQGISTVSDTGVSIISRQIEDQILPLLDPSYTNFDKATFGLFYQSDRKFILFTVTETSDVWATQAFVYNVITNAWTKWIMSKASGLVNVHDDKMYFGPSDINFIEQERKNFNNTDHADREYTKVVVSNSRLITQITAAPVTVITAKLHGLKTGDVISIEATDSTPLINDTYEVTVLDINSFTVPVTVTVAGTEGIWNTEDKAIPIKIKIVSLSDMEVGDAITQDKMATVNLTSYNYVVESVIKAIDPSEGTITIASFSNFAPGNVTLYKAIPTKVEWIPIHAGDPSVLKHFREVHVMLDKFRAGTVAVVFRNEIQRWSETALFDTNVFWEWGKFPWGRLPWGGEYTYKNLRTYVPWAKQKCRLLSMTFTHRGARDQWKLEGIAIFLKVLQIGERTNRG